MVQRSAFCKYALCKVQFVDEKCNSCGLCAMKCKASCIDSKNKQIDYSRCVTCFNCLEVCKHNAMKYRFGNPFQKRTAGRETSFKYLAEEKRSNAGFTSKVENRSMQVQEVDESKRRFLSASLITSWAAGSLIAQRFRTDYYLKRPLHTHCTTAHFL